MLGDGVPIGIDDHIGTAKPDVIVRDAASAFGHERLD